MPSKRATWDNSKEFRDAVQEDLENWGNWSRGAWPRLDLSSRPEAKGADYDVARAEFTEYVLSRMSQASLSALRNALVIRMHYATSKPSELKAQIMKVSKRTFYRRLKDAEFEYWVESLRKDC